MKLAPELDLFKPTQWMNSFHDNLKRALLRNQDWMLSQWRPRPKRIKTNPVKSSIFSLSLILTRFVCLDFERRPCLSFYPNINKNCPRPFYLSTDAVRITHQVLIFFVSLPNPCNVHKAWLLSSFPVKSRQDSHNRTKKRKTSNCPDFAEKGVRSGRSCPFIINGAACFLSKHSLFWWIKQGIFKESKSRERRKRGDGFVFFVDSFPYFPVDSTSISFGRFPNGSSNAR